jgi:hypothetical protein
MRIFQWEMFDVEDTMMGRDVDMLVWRLIGPDPLYLEKSISRNEFSQRVVRKSHVHSK